MGYASLARRIVAVGAITVGVGLVAMRGARAADICAPYFSGLRTANTLLYDASKAAQRQQTQQAREDYRRAATLLRSTPPGITDARCDPPNYLYTKYAVEMHAIASSTDLATGTAIAAFGAMTALEQHFFAAPAPAAVSSIAWYYMSRYPVTAGDIARYTQTVYGRYAAQEQALHAPTGRPCQFPTLPPLAIRAVTIYPPPFGMPAGTYLAVVTVKLDADGKVLSTRVARSSGNAGIDADAQRAAQLSTYVPGVRKCARVPSTFRFDRTYVIAAQPK